MVWDKEVERIKFSDALTSGVINVSYQKYASSVRRPVDMMNDQRSSTCFPPLWFCRLKVDINQFSILKQVTQLQ